MGIFVNLDIIPDEISQKEWESVYDETLTLIEAYPFMDKIRDTEKYGSTWVYTDKTRERKLKLDNSYQIGWHAFGDMLTMLSAESFILVKNLGYYGKPKISNGNIDDDGDNKDNKDNNKINKDNHIDNHKDILCSLIYKNDNITEKIPHVGRCVVFDSKTQGQPFHTYILAIACLIESRFPKYAMVHGNISKGQIKRAISWANKILKKPINITDRADNTKLLHRLKNIFKKEASILEAFIQLSINKIDVEFGNFIRNNFSIETIIWYYTSIFKQYHVNSIGFNDRLVEFLNQGYTLEMACDICVLNEDGCKLEPSQFIKTVLSLLETQNIIYNDDDDDSSDSNKMRDFIDFASNNPNSDEPDTVTSLLGKTFLRLCGFIKPITQNITFEKAEQIFIDKFKDICDVPLILKENEFIPANEDESDNSKSTVNESKETLKGIIKELSSLINEKIIKTDKTDKTDKSEKVDEKGKSAGQCKPNLEYDIEDIDLLNLWKPGDTISPYIEKLLNTFRTSLDSLLEEKAEIYRLYNDLSKIEKIELVIKNNEYFYISKKAWDYIFENIEDAFVFDRIFSVLSIEAKEVNINMLCKALINNKELFGKYLLQ